MKAIAEYFRDLAADDRYFGAEPPQPDVEMLARIAEREVERRVEARMSETGIHLRTESAAAALTAAEALDQVRATEPSSPSEGIDDTAAEALVESGGTVDDAAAFADQAAIEDSQDVTDPDDIREDTDSAGDAPLTEIASVEDDIESDAEADAVQTAEIPAEKAGHADSEEFDEPASHHAEASQVETVQDVSVQDAPKTNIMSASWDFPMSGLTGEAAPASARTDASEYDDSEEQSTLDEAPVAEEVTQRTDLATQTEPGSITDKLRRIREVVARNQSGGAGYEEDQHAEDIVGSTTDVNDVSDTAYVDELDEDDFADELASEWESYDEDLLEDDDLTGDADVFDELKDDLSEDASFQTATGTSVADKPAAQDDDAPVAEPSDVATQGSIATPPAPSGMPTPPAAQDDAAKTAPRRRVRVVKVKRADIEASLDNGELKDTTSQDSSDDDVHLSDAEESELQRELAEVEAELTGETIRNDEAEVAELADEASEEFDLSDEDMAEFDDDEAAADASAARLLEQAAGAEEDALDRLMAEADSQMEEPESTSRRSAFSHLRAAVAATKADDKLSEAAKSPGDEDYRTDLAAAVKPRRPVADGNRTLRPGNERPAPLKLVAEQRVDSPQAKTGPVLPRRVSAPAATAEDDGGTFAEYAEARGAKELPEVLEAAASYLSFVEGRAQFSRPQLMTKVRQLGLDDFTREDGLRHFGQLLRAGKIEKIKGGRFTVSDDIGFRPDPDDQRQVG